jgi:two-component system, OmpR family, phosphate regulon response regulator OmpR
VLVVDDEPAVLEVLEHVLAEAGHEVTAAQSAEHARKHCRRAEYDAAVVDFVMPGEDGLSLAEFLRGGGVPVLLITGAMTFDELLGHGMPILGKPFSSAQLEVALRHLLERRVASTRDR